MAVGQNVIGVGAALRARPAPADGRAGGIGDAHRRSGDRSRLRPAVRSGRRAGRGHARGRRRHGRHRLRRLLGGPIATCLLEPIGRAARLAPPRGAQAVAAARRRRRASPRQPDAAARRRGRRVLRPAQGARAASWWRCGRLVGQHDRTSRRMDITLPAYIGAMLVAAVIRNLDDATRLVRHVAADARRHRRTSRCRCSW